MFGAAEISAAAASYAVAQTNHTKNTTVHSAVFCGTPRRVSDGNGRCKTQN
jgi:hypothetical protein